MATEILRLPAVKARTGLSRSTIYLRVSECEFPKPISLGGRAIGWIEEEINDWLKERITVSRNANKRVGGQI
jgi:prophage regulatory protein